MQQKILVFGNWKMNPSTEKEASALLRSYGKIEIPKNTELALFVPIPFLAESKRVLSRKRIPIGVQNIYPGTAGAETGEIALSMLSQWKPSYVLVGHSERRALGETDELVNQKIFSVLKYGATPVLCVGERERDEHGFFLRTVEDMLKQDLKDVPKSALSKIVIAYEPVWAIGANAVRETTPEECREMIIFIKKAISDISGGSIKAMPKVIYGGSVNELNAHEYIVAGADGILPGHLSLDPKKMQKLLQNITAVHVQA